MKFNSARDLFFNQIGAVVEKEDIYIVSADLAGQPFDDIRSKYPQRFVQVGIAEQNMISVAVGLALTGKKTIAYTSNPFCFLRAYDQIRNGATMQSVPLTIVGVGTGFSIAEYGTTHFVTEDVALASLIPGLMQITVSDDEVAAAAVEEFLKNEKFLYIRFDKMCGDILYDRKVDLEQGFSFLEGNSDTLLISQGYQSQLIKDIKWESGNEPNWVDVFAMPFDREKLLTIIENCQRIVVCEENQKSGGLYSTILEIINSSSLKRKVNGLCVNYKEHFPEKYGSREYWLHQFMIDKEAIYNAVMEKERM